MTKEECIITHIVQGEFEMFVSPYNMSRRYRLSCKLKISKLVVYLPPPPPLRERRDTMRVTKMSGKGFFSRTKIRLVHTQTRLYTPDLGGVFKRREHAYVL